MTTYILLRDNKESQPCTLTDLKNLGLKSSDLIWVEGQSVCWQHPGQIKELRPFTDSPYTVYQDPTPLPPVYKTVLPDIKDKFEPVLPKTKKEKEVVAKETEPEEKHNLADQKHIFVSLPQVAHPENMSPLPKPRSLAVPPPVSQPDIPAYTEPKTIEPVKEYVSHAIAAQPVQAYVKPAPLTKQPERISAAKSPAPVIPVQVKKIAAYAALFIIGIAAGLGINKLFQNKAPTVASQPSPATVASTSVTDEELSDSSAIYANSEEGMIQGPTMTDLTPQQQLLAQQAKRNQSKKGTNTSTDTATAVQPVPEPEPKVEEVKPEEPKEKKKHSIKEIYSQVAVRSNDYSVGSFGGIKNLELTVSNNSQYSLDEVEVQIQYLKPMDEPVKSETISFRSIPPGGKKTIPVKKSNRGVKVTYKITGIESKDFQITTAGL